MRQKGQVLLILLLVMTVGLAIGLSVIQRSLTDLSTASKLEQSSRALSVAEAGIERALSGNTQNTVDFQSDNRSNASVIDSGLIPLANNPLEYPPLTKEDIAQFWLANPDPALSLPKYYAADTLLVYWGSPGLSDSEKAALELSIIYQDNSLNYAKKQYFYDPVATRRTNNNFTDPGVGCTSSPAWTISGSSTSYYCKITLNGLDALTGVSGKLIMARVRFLYNTIAQPLALAPAAGFSLPPQAHIYTSTGISGDAQRRIQLFKLDQVVPPYFDYAIFSAGDITK